ncbi:hypothetical protein ABPG77_004760 [Micractinium sp. CCAP 211/92]
MALAQFAKKAVAGLGLRCGTPLLSEGGSALGGLLGSRFYSHVPNELKYSKEHEWVHVKEGDIVSVGITDHAQAELGDLVHIELPDVGSTVTAGEEFGVVESVKAASDIIAPVSGEVVEINEGVIDEPEVVNSDPYWDGWMIKVKLSNKGQLDELMDAAAYKSFCEGK